MILSILVSLTAIIGTVLLARDAFVGIRKSIKLRLPENQIQLYENQRENLIKRYEELKSTHYTEEEINRFIDDINSKYQSKINEAEAKISKIDSENSFKNFKYGILGLILIVTSFIIQFFSSSQQQDQLEHLNDRIEKLENKLSY